MLRKIQQHFHNSAKTVRIAFLIIYDILAVCFAEFLALWTRFEFSTSHITPEFGENAFQYAVINAAVTVFIFAFLKLYSSLWQYASVQEMMNVLVACLLAAGSQSVGMHMLMWNMPRSYYILYFFFLLALICFSRFFYRGIRVVRNSYTMVKNVETVPTMVIGAGDTACSLIKDMNNSSVVLNHVVCVIDADLRKIGNSILGVPIVGNDDKILWAVEKYAVKEIFIAIPHLTAKRKKEIIEICKNSGCKIKILPSVAQLVNEEVTVSKFREVEIEDLLGREPVKTNLDEVMGYISNSVVLVTGGGGSIGSELCRQIAFRSVSACYRIVSVCPRQRFFWRAAGHF